MGLMRAGGVLVERLKQLQGAFSRNAGAGVFGGEHNFTTLSVDPQGLESSAMFFGVIDQVGKAKRF